jgi:hypothetical protein
MRFSHRHWRRLNRWFDSPFILLVVNRWVNLFLRDFNSTWSLFGFKLLLLNPFILNFIFVAKICAINRWIFLRLIAVIHRRVNTRVDEILAWRIKVGSSSTLTVIRTQVDNSFWIFIFVSFEFLQTLVPLL